uniref:AsIV-cont00053-ORF2 n=1 Tax=Apophua simplicipes ichnovirus TaxID=1329648 RepID=S5DT09_9VIRU|nr:AsIV-cont00053-ORF2 [Apophua simplicipes ichnovirus]
MFVASTLNSASVNFVVDGRLWSEFHQMENPNHVFGYEKTLTDVKVHNDQNDEREEIQSPSPTGPIENVRDRSPPIYGITKTIKVAMDDKIEKENSKRYEIVDIDQSTEDMNLNEESKMLSKKKSKINVAISGWNFLNSLSNPDDIPEHVVLYRTRKDVFKTFKQIYAKQMFLTCVRETSSRRNAKLLSLWFWRILSLILAISFLLVYINSTRSVHHIHHIFSWNIQ